MITRKDLVRTLKQRKVPDWVVVERAQDIAIHDGDLRRRDRRTRLTFSVHRDDGARGRGSARIAVTASDGDPGALVDGAMVLATLAIGPPWQPSPPAAPAKVAVLDPDLGDDLETRAELLVQNARAAAATASAAIAASSSVLRETVSVNASSGFHTEWTASELRVAALLVIADRSVEVVREERRRSMLDFEEAITSAARDLTEVAQAIPPERARYDVMIGVEALLHGDGLGLWQVFAAQADSVVERQGITRYRVENPIADGAHEVSEPLSITSDGALPFGIRSAPVGEDGDAIRRFPLVERGVCVGLGLTVREAALRRREPNGGVRNLVVAPGLWMGKPSGNRTLEVRRLRALSIDPLSGDASLEILLAFDHGRNALVTGGTLRLDLVSALATARRSSATMQRGPYQGPSSILIAGVELIV